MRFMKKIFVASLFAALLMLSSSAYAADTSTITQSSTTASVTINLSVELDYSQWSGSGTAADPYVLTSVSDIDLLSRYVAMGYETSGKYFVLKNDITFADSDTFTPIGTADAPFKGNFDAKDHKISSIKYSGSDSYVGFFGYVDGGEIKNLILHGCEFTVSADKAIGSLVGYQKSGTITNCANVFCYMTNNGSGSTGGLVGTLNSGSILKYCLYIPNIGTSDIIGDGSGTVTCVYGTSNSYALATEVITGHVQPSIFIPGEDITKTDGINVREPLIMFNDYVYAGKDKTITLLVSADEGYEVTKINSNATLINNVTPFK